MILRGLILILVFSQFVLKGTCAEHEPHINSISFLTRDGMETRVLSNETEMLRTTKTNIVRIEYLLSGNDIYVPYEYILEGEDKDWTITIGEGDIIYTNLGTGIYTFRIRTAGGDPNLAGESVQRFRIILPLWNSNPAIIFYFVVILGGLVFFINFRTKSLRRSNLILKEKEQKSLLVVRQKEELTIKNRNITDSIRYAQKMQQSLLPTPEYFRKLLPCSFVFFRPRDMVSGDFHWITEARGKVFVVSADCTGHGVPGALMSMIGFEILGQAIHDKGLDDPARIIKYLSTSIESSFRRNVDDPLLVDGIDLGLLVVDRKKEMAEFAGAFSTLYMVRDNRLEEIRGNRLTAGTSGTGPDTSFDRQSIELKKDDTFYLFSDGYPDQFGGERGKKFMYRRFKHMLLTIHNLPMDKQKEFLGESLDAWMGEQSQVDDIQVIGLKPLC